LRSRRTAAPAIPPSVHGDDEVKDWFRDVLFPTYELWVMSPRRSPAAMMVLNGGWVEQLYVSQDRFRRGSGSSCCASLRAHEMTCLLWTFEANGARAFDGKHAFAAVRVSADNEEGVPALCYRWSASPTGSPKPPPASG
jgi:hypothetical protein